MMRHYKKLLLILLVGFMAMTVPAPKAQAFEPISMSILAGILIPIVLPYVIKAMPYIWQGMKNMAYAMFETGVEMAGILYLPIGLFETMFGWPFGLFKHGLSTTWEGCKAPFSAMGTMFLIPLKTFGVM